MKIDDDYKIRVTPEQSEKIQEICFGQGMTWASGDKEVMHTDCPYLYIHTSEGEISCMDETRGRYFKSYHYSHSQISAEKFIKKFNEGVSKVYEREVIYRNRLDENQLIEEIREIQKLEGFSGFRSIHTDADSMPSLTYYITRG